MRKAKHKGLDKHAKETFQAGRNVSLERAIKREMPDASEAEVRFHALWPPTTGARAGGTYWQQVRAALLQALHDHVGGRVSLPTELAQFILDAIHDLSQGETPEVFVPRRIPGGRGNRLKTIAQRQVQTAVHYLIAVERAEIHDARSRASVARAYGVSERQVARWLRAAGPKALRNSQYEKYSRNLRMRGKNVDVAGIVKKLMQIFGKDFQNRDTRVRRGSAGAK